MGIENWRINELSGSVGGDTSIRFVELYALPSATADNCLFSSTRLEILDGAGGSLGDVYPTSSTICLPGNFYYVFATDAAVAHYGVSRDHTLNVAIPNDGQLCLKSSGTRYDCVRWGLVTNPVTSLASPSDVTTAATLVDGEALARRSDTGVVAADFVLKDPTPRQPNDGTVWIPPDAGLPPDADLTPDAGISDAWILSDAPPIPKADARVQPGWFAADPGGGPALSCAVSHHGAPGLAGAWLLMAALAVALLWRAR